MAMIVVIYLLKSCYSTEEIRKLIELGLSLSGNEITYNRFCDAIENAMFAVFGGSVHIEDMAEKGREQRYLMDNFALSFACKMYVQFVLKRI